MHRLDEQKGGNENTEIMLIGFDTKGKQKIKLKAKTTLYLSR